MSDIKEIRLRWNEEHKKWEEYQEPYATVECPTKEDYEALKKSVLLGEALRNPKTNADRIRAMSDEEMAKAMAKADTGCFCEYLPECMDDLEHNRDIPDVRCEVCAIRWLQQPVGGVEHE